MAIPLVMMVMAYFLYGFGMAFLTRLYMSAVVSSENSCAAKVPSALITNVFLLLSTL